MVPIHVAAAATDARKLAERLKVAWPVAETTLVVLDADGGPPADGVGYPAGAAGRERWGKMLRSTARRLTDAGDERPLQPLGP
jgi:hypothetical protein